MKRPEVVAAARLGRSIFEFESLRERHPKVSGREGCLVPRGAGVNWPRASINYQSTGDGGSRRSAGSGPNALGIVRQQVVVGVIGPVSERASREVHRIFAVEVIDNAGEYSDSLLGGLATWP